MRRTWLTGFSAMSWIACSVLVGRGPRGGVAALKSARQLGRVPRVQPPSVAARVRNVASVSVEVPFGELATAEPTLPVAGRTKLGTVAAAFGSPGDGPVSFTPRRKRDSESADATA